MIEFHAHVRQSLYGPFQEFAVVGIDPEREGQSVLTGLVWETMPDGALSSETPRLFDRVKDQERFVRAIFNACWDAGMRPDGFDDTRESMKATNAHLQDMRAIAFGKLEIPSPETQPRRST